MMNERCFGVRDFRNKMEQLSLAIERLGEASHDMAMLAGQIIIDSNEIDRMKNCVNCEHFEVCVVVHDRKRRQAGDYTACGKWKLVEK